MSTIRSIATKFRGGPNENSPTRVRMTVQLSSALLDAIEARAGEEAIPVAVFIRRAITRTVDEAHHMRSLPRREVASFEEAQRKGRRGPMRQWPKGVSYVVDQHISDELKALAEEHDIDVSALAREAIVGDLDRPSTIRRVQPRDETGFTTSGAPHLGRASQRVMDAAWRSTTE